MLDKNRQEHIIEVDEMLTDQPVAASTCAVPGIMSNRGCCYAGCKDAALGSLKDVLVLTHGAIGCGYYSWGTQRNKTKQEEDGGEFSQYCFSTDLQEPDIIFGGEKKLRQAIKEAVEIFQPECIMICSTCPVGLIGDDIHAVAADAEREYGIRCIAFSCEGYKGDGQSGGQHIANNMLMRKVIGTGDKEPKTRYAVNLLGEYSMGGDGWESVRLLKRIGYEVVSVMTGDGSYAALKNAHLANLNLVQCDRSINGMAEMMQTKYGTDWLKINFTGIEATIQSLRELAMFFDDEDLYQRTEEVIADELAQIEEERVFYRQKLEGKTAALYVGGSRARHYQYLLADFGVKTVLTGHECSHRDDEEGREIIPRREEDADSKNREHLAGERDELRFRSFLTDEQYQTLRRKIALADGKGMIRDMKTGAIIVDDLNHGETEELLRVLKPDIFLSGLKDPYVLQKAGVVSRQLHCHDYSGPYAGFQGAVNFARDITMGLYTPAWRFVTPPWKNQPLRRARRRAGGGEENVAVNA